MAIPEFMIGGEVGSSAKITQNPYAGEITSSASIGDKGVQVALAANPVTQGPVPSSVDTTNGARTEIRGVPPKFTLTPPSSVDTSGGMDNTMVPGGIYPATMRPPSSVDTSRNR
jgi:hypothetical protein